MDMKLTRIMELEHIKRFVKITDYLRAMGHLPVCRGQKIEKYFAPWRDEKEPSLAVYYHKEEQDWFDYGDRKGGSVIDFVMRYHGISYKEAVQRLRALISYENVRV